MEEERLYIVTYDIADDRRWRSVFRLMKGYGEWVQLSVFQCRLGRARHAEFVARLSELLNQREDHVMIMDLGSAARVEPRVQSIGKRTFEPVERVPIIV
jgi:CRISPR-associated protein Cas2